MFESAEVGHTLDRKTWEAELPALRAGLLNAQYDVAQAKRFPVVVLVGGLDGATNGETVKSLLEWMDPRHLQVTAFPEPGEEERMRPPMWRYWRALPPRGKIAALFGGWHTPAFVQRAEGRSTDAEFDQAIERVERFERMLVDEGVLLLKFWLHVPEKALRRRLKELASRPETAWRVTPLDRRRLRRYDDYRVVAEHLIRRTTTAEAPWMVVEATDERYRNLTVGRSLLASVRERLDETPGAASPDRTPVLLPPADGRNVLTRLDYGRSIPKPRYERMLERWQGRLATLTRDPRFRDRALVVVFEGSDAAGKGGAIRRVTGALDPRQYTVIPVAAPTEEERAQPYLWRFWRHVPRLGRITLFDRSWYGRVLVERVEGFASEPDWMRAYGEINDFEHQLRGAGVVVAKYYLAITPEEQLERFRAREHSEFKRFKLTDEDWRNREKWGEYERAVCDMVDRTSTRAAPWTLIPANDKRWARVEILKTLCRRLERALA